MKNVYSNIAIDSSNSQTNFSNFNSMKILKPLDHATISSRDCGSSSAITGQHSHQMRNISQTNLNKDKLSIGKSEPLQSDIDTQRTQNI